MELDRTRIVDENFIKRVLAQDFPVAKSKTLPVDVQLDKESFLELFDSQLITRHVDILARKLREQQQGFYTIASSGHEGNAAIAKVFKKDDIAFLHYRSGAFMVQRAKKCPDIDIIYDQILSLVASSDDPISAGRHKVFGSVPLFIPPQTSTIASHLPKAFGCALSLIYAKSLKDHDFTMLPTDSVVLCSFGDASLNHSTAQGALNASQWIANAQLPLPIVWICEDNGFGISVPPPSEWIEKTCNNRKGIEYIQCDGRNLADVYLASQRAQHLARIKHKPVFLHMKTVRLLGHAGSDIESQYRKQADIDKSEFDDPLLHSARMIYENKWLTCEEIIKLYEARRTKVQESSKRAVLAPKLRSASEVMSSIVPPRRDKSSIIISSSQTYDSTKRTMAQCLNLALNDILIQYPQAVLFGEDVGKKGGVYRITAGLQEKFSAKRVFDTLLDEQTILGTAIGFAHNGFLPIPEIQFLAYLHNACDQIRGEASTLSFFSKGQFTNPMVVRIPSFAYQKGIGGHFHNENSIAFLREIPGLIIICPSTAKDAALLLRQAVALAYQEQRVVIFLEPIALYMTKDLYQDGDGLACQVYPESSKKIDVGEFGIEGEENSDIVIISYGNGMHLSRQAAYLLKNKHQIAVKLIDLRMLAPLNTNGLRQELEGKSKVIIVDECRKTGSISEQIITWMVEELSPLPQIQRVTAEDSFIPLGKAWEYILPSKEKIIASVLAIRRN
ncbi:MAG: MFS transporter [Gammaproteobacteria bacterium]|jgi:2-oxoisovalerate dehydrogenase E1 component|nr:MFS transporter [Gammaproteobacteria bacterium]